jgi:hypothetical protein
MHVDPRSKKPEEERCWEVREFEGSIVKREYGRLIQDRLTHEEASDQVEQLNQRQTK